MRGSPTPGTSCTWSGGTVRDLMLGRAARDLDFCTERAPARDHGGPAGLGRRQYLVGVRFGTVGALKDGTGLEITTYREEVYGEEHRKPAVTFGKDVETDLSRRDFTINAMAIRLPDGGFVDPFGGVKALAARRSTRRSTPRSRSATTRCGWSAPRGSSRSSGSRPRRACSTRSARWAAPRDRLGRADPRRARPAAASPSTSGGARAPRRVRARRPVPARAPGAPPGAGPRPPAQGRAAAHVRGGRRDRAATAPAAGGAAARHRQAGDARDHRRRRVVPPPRGGRARGWPRTADARCATRARRSTTSCTLIELHLRFHGYGEGWTDAAVRRYVRDAGPLLDDLNQLTRADVTTRNPKRAEAFRRLQDELEERIARARRAGEPRGDAPAARRAGR